MIRLGMMMCFCVWALLGPSAKASYIGEYLIYRAEAEGKEYLKKKKQQELLLSQLIASNDDLISLNHANPYLPNSEIDIYQDELIPVYNDMILTQRIAKLVNALKKELPRQQMLLSKLAALDKNKLQEIKKEIIKRTKIYEDFVCAYRRSIFSKVSSNIDDRNACDNSVGVELSKEKSDSLDPYMAILKRALNLTQQLAQAYPSEETDSAGENPSPTWIKQIAELEQDIQELITLGQTIKEENQA